MKKEGGKKGKLGPDAVSGWIQEHLMLTTLKSVN